MISPLRFFASSVLVLALYLSFACSFEIGMRILVLNSGDTSSNDAIYEALESRGIPRDSLMLPYTGSLPLLDNTGAPKYYAIVIADYGSNVDGGSGLTLDQQAQVPKKKEVLPFSFSFAYLFRVA